MSKKYLAEFIGTFTLSFTVLIALAFTGALPLAVPVIAGLTLALFVYTIGPISGCHINPAVTLGLLSIKKISKQDAVWYILAQFAGALLAILIANFFGIASPMTAAEFNSYAFVAETLGAVFFTFGIAAVIYGRAKDQMSGFVVGGSLVLGVVISSLSGAAGVLNPAVALAVNSFTIVYLLAPILGAFLGFNLYKYLTE